MLDLGAKNGPIDCSMTATRRSEMFAPRSAFTVYNHEQLVGILRDEKFNFVARINTQPRLLETDEITNLCVCSGASLLL